MAGWRAEASSMSVNDPSACWRITSRWYDAPTSQLPGPGVATLRWLAQKSTMTSNSWRRDHSWRPRVAVPKSVAASQDPRATDPRIVAGSALASGNAAQIRSASSSGMPAGSSCRAIQASMPPASTSANASGVGPKVARRSRWSAGRVVSRIVGTTTWVAAAASPAVG